jgi:hypothetical protein
MYLSGDEFGLFGIAAYWAGLDWSETVSRIGYYSFGYSVLLLPFFWIADDMTLIYKGALIINSLFAAAIVPIAYYLAKQWGLRSIREDKMFVLLLLFAALTGCVVAYSNLGLGEVLLIFLGWVNTALFYKLQKKGTKLPWFGLSAFLLVYGYTVHQRFLGVLIAGIVAIILLKILRKIDSKQVATFFIAVFILFSISILIKQDVQANVWLAPNGMRFNDYGGMLLSFQDVLTTDGLLSAIRVFCGQLFYIGVASSMLVYLALYDLIKTHVAGIKKLLSKQMADMSFDLSLTFILLAFVLTFGISVIAMHSPVRLDHAVYGRYNDIIYQVLSFYILVKLIVKKQIKSKAILKITAFFVFLYIAVREILPAYFSNIPFMLFNSINLGLYWRNNQNINSGDIHIFFGFFVPLLVGSLLLYSSFRKKHILCSLSIAISICLSVGAASIFHYYVVMSPERAFEGFNSILNNAKEEKAPVYFWNDGRNYTSSYLQMYLYDVPLHITDAENVVRDQPICLFAKKAAIFEVAKKYNTEVLDVFSDIVLLKCRGRTWEGNYSILPSSFFNTKFSVEEQYFISDGSRYDALMHGPYMPINEGYYTFEIDCELLNGNGEYAIGIADFVINQGSGKMLTLSELDINANDFFDGKLTLRLPVDVTENLGGFELRVFVNEGVEMRITEVRVKAYDYFNKLSENVANDFSLTNNSDGMFILQSKSHIDDSFVLPISLFFTKFFISDQTALVSDGSRFDALMYGPYMPIEKGDYTFEIDCELLVGGENAIGSADFVANQSDGEILTLSGIDIKVSDFSDDKLTLRLPVNVTEDIEKFELRLFVNEGVAIRITEVRVNVDET